MIAGSSCGKYCLLQCVQVRAVKYKSSIKGAPHFEQKRLSCLKFKSPRALAARPASSEEEAQNIHIQVQRISLRQRSFQNTCERLHHPAETPPIF